MINLTTKEYHLIRCLINGQTLYKFSHVDVDSKKGLSTAIEGNSVYVTDVPLSKNMLISDIDSRDEIRDILGNSIPFRDLLSKLLTFATALPPVDMHSNILFLDKATAEDLKRRTNYYIGELD